MACMTWGPQRTRIIEKFDTYSGRLHGEYPSEAKMFPIRRPQQAFLQSHAPDSHIALLSSPFLRSSDNNLSALTMNIYCICCRKSYSAPRARQRGNSISMARRTTTSTIFAPWRLIMRQKMNKTIIWKRSLHIYLRRINRDSEPACSA